jgi:hypothetical protein
MWNYSELFLQNLSTLFRTSLLITGSVESAECALVEAIGILRKFEPAAEVLSREAVAFAVASCSVRVLQLAKFASDSVPESALTLVHDDLRTVLELPPDLRCCFVLRSLTGYSREQVGLLMNIKSENVDMLAQNALVRFAALSHKRGQNAAAFTPASSFLQNTNPIEDAN